MSIQVLAIYQLRHIQALLEHLGYWIIQIRLQYPSPAQNFAYRKILSKWYITYRETHSQECFFRLLDGRLQSLSQPLLLSPCWTVCPFWLSPFIKNFRPQQKFKYPENIYTPTASYWKPRRGTQQSICEFVLFKKYLFRGWKTFLNTNM